MSNDKAKQIKYLKKLVIYGKKLKKNILKYQRELNRIDKKSVITRTKKYHTKSIKKKTIKKKRKKTRTKTKHHKTIKNRVKIIPKDILYPSSKIIVIDPGHGGKDAGAVNRRIYEKNIVLKIGKYLRTELKKSGFIVYMTRDRDHFVKLSHRTKYANRKKADLFISIHANSVRKNKAKKAHGIETYFLSPARSARAKRVAALENRDGVNKMSYSTKNSLLTILNQTKITQSNKLAIDVQKNMLYNLRKRYGKNAIKDSGVREAPFWVLVGAAMPSILIEVGYVSNPIEKKRLNTISYQKLIAYGIAQGIKSYFLKNSY